jgi:hypothetical protein
MQHPSRQASKALQGKAYIQIPHQRRHTGGTQFSHPCRRGGRCQHPHPAPHVRSHPQTHIAAANNEYTFPPETGWQGTKGVLV